MTFSKKARRDMDAAMNVLFGDPPVEPEVWFSEVGLPQSIGWDRYRFEDACARLCAIGWIRIRYTADGQAHAINNVTRRYVNAG